MDWASHRWPLIWRFTQRLLSAVVIVLSLVPAPEAAAPLFAFDKLIHASVYSLLTFVSYQALRRMLPALAYSFGLGALIEAIQSVLPYRSGEWLDLLANLLGVTIGAGIIWIARRR